MNDLRYPTNGAFLQLSSTSVLTSKDERF